MQKPDTIKCDEALLKLFLAKKDSGMWLTEAAVGNGVMNTDGLKPLRSALSKICDVVLSEVALRPEVTKEEIVDVVVVIPERKDRVWTEKDLATIDPEIQAKTWKSVVRISSKEVPGCSGTALVVDRTPTHLYLLTNLHLWDDATCAKHLSAAELTRYRNVHPTPKLSDEIAKQPRRGPQVVVEQHTATEFTSILSVLVRYIIVS
ncbi:hypothetical protein V7S43_012553 [Phytophthora oleae]|uniref:Crinkler (CRN) family protein n=1 Tax=Phytophthora oleae TaxID=2107226 RepID=A0ABD3F5V9_9STRA